MMIRDQLIKHRACLLACVSILLSAILFTASFVKVQAEPVKIEDEWIGLSRDVDSMIKERGRIEARFKKILEANPADEIEGPAPRDLNYVLQHIGSLHFEGLVFDLSEYIDIQSRFVLNGLKGGDDTQARYPAVRSLVALGIVGADRCLGELGQTPGSDKQKRRLMCYVIRHVYGDDLSVYLINQRIEDATLEEAKAQYEAALEQINKMIKKDTPSD